MARMDNLSEIEWRKRREDFIFSAIFVLFLALLSTAFFVLGYNNGRGSAFRKMERIIRSAEKSNSYVTFDDGDVYEVVRVRQSQYKLRQIKEAGK